MVHRLPAVLIGGPPHAGKSVLFHSLTTLLHQQSIPHYAMRACPDGEGNWSQECDLETVQRLRKKLSVWPEAYVSRICFNLEHRCLPFLVDAGGRPTESQKCILRQCTHSILLLKEDDAEGSQFWLKLAEEIGLLPLAQIYSERAGLSTVISARPILTGTITGLERERTSLVEGDMFAALFKTVKSLFKYYGADELKMMHEKNAPSDPIDLPTALHAIDPSTQDWRPEMLPELLNSISAEKALSVYGRGPNWLYATLAAHVHEFYQFDPKLPSGWIQPANAIISEETFPDLHVEKSAQLDATTLSVRILPDRLEYFQSRPLPFPTVHTEKGLIIDGKLPAWLVTALVRLYKNEGLPWIACHEPRLSRAVVVYSRTATYTPGHCVPIQL